jgi:hypothetical protein
LPALEALLPLEEKTPLSFESICDFPIPILPSCLLQEESEGACEQSRPCAGVECAQ